MMNISTRNTKPARLSVNRRLVAALRGTPIANQTGCNLDRGHDRCRFIEAGGDGQALRRGGDAIIGVTTTGDQRSTRINRAVYGALGLL